jgi:DeoR/GlpR family transcriptional regulator of sugar metabolism
MFAQSRQAAICALVARRRRVSVAELQSALATSPATLRRDLHLLERLGKVARSHGGVTHPAAAQAEVPFDRKQRQAMETKLAIATAAAALAPRAGTVFVDAGTTALELGRRLLRAHPDLTIATNSIPLLNERRENGGRLLAVGGEVRAVSLALVGAGALAWVRQLRFDVAFLGCSGIDAAEGATTTELTEAELKGGVAARSRRVVLLADARKWGQPAAIQFARWDQVHDWVTDYRPSTRERTALAGQGVRLHPATG